MLTINKIKFEFESFYNGDLRINKEKYKIDVTRINIVEYTHDSEEDHKDLAIQQYVLSLLTQLKETFNLLIISNTLPMERNDKDVLSDKFENDDYLGLGLPWYNLSDSMNITSHNHNNGIGGTHNPYQPRPKIYLPKQKHHVVFPDKGSQDRYDYQHSCSVGSKERVNGTIKIELGLPKSVDECIIIDDICSMGGTFITIAKQYPDIKWHLKVSKTEKSAWRKHIAGETELKSLFETIEYGEIL